MKTYGGHEILREPDRIIEHHYYHDFRVVGKGFGWSVPCGKGGKLLEPDEHREALYAGGMKGEIEGEKTVYHGIQSYANVYNVPAIIKCGCGNGVELSDVMTNRCSKCGAFFRQIVERKLQTWILQLVRAI